ncbi:MAG: hypothetical protein AB1625_10820 [Acidobacteriota bacterium]
MAAVTLHDLNQRYVRLSDRCRSQWTFYQLLQGLFKHLRGLESPVSIDFPALFGKLREIGADLGHPETQRTEKAIALLGAQLDGHARSLLDADTLIAPSDLRRFFDRLRNQDERVLLAIIKFYLDGGGDAEDQLDKLDLLFTRLAEIPREDGTSLVRERHEIERIVQPLVLNRSVAATPDHEVEILLNAVSDLKAEALGCRSFGDLVGGGVLDRFRTLKRRLSVALLHPRLLPAVVETTIAIKNRFRELWEEEEAQILDDTNRVMELQRQLENHPEMLTGALRDAFETFAAARLRFDQGRQDDNLRRETVVELRRTLNLILEQFDLGQASAPEAVVAVEPPGLFEEEEDDESAPSTDLRVPAIETRIPVDPLLAEYASKISFAVELAGLDRPAHEAVHSNELASLRLEPWEVEACRRSLTGNVRVGTLLAERDRLLLDAAALRVRMDEEAREIDRLQRRGSDRLGDVLERATQSLQRATELERRFQWFIDDALYRGDTKPLEGLYRSRFRLLRAHSGLWLIHNERGGVSPY